MIEGTRQELKVVAAVGLIGCIVTIAHFETPPRNAGYIVEVNFVDADSVDGRTVLMHENKGGKLLGLSSLNKSQVMRKTDGLEQEVVKEEPPRTKTSTIAPGSQNFHGPGSAFGHESWKMTVPITGEKINMHPRVNYCRKKLLASEPSESLNGLHLGCFSRAEGEFVSIAPNSNPKISPLECIHLCVAESMQFAGLESTTNGLQCRCSNTFSQSTDLSKFQSRCPTGCNGSMNVLGGHCDGINAYRTGPWPPPFGFVANSQLKPSQTKKTITVFIWANPRLAAIFRTCRLASMSFRYEYDVYDLRHQVRNSNHVNTLALMDLFPGPKILVFDGCCVPGWLMKNWPQQTLLVIASDETARWGFELAGKKKFYPLEWNETDVIKIDGQPGKHGPDEFGRIKMPPKINPWFKQYYSVRHKKFFEDNVRYIPLGSREEFADPPSVFKPPSTRKYLYSFMGAPTDISRKKVRDIVKADTKIPKTRVFLHMAEHWDANPNSDRNTYIKPEQYREVMLESVFTICPKGHSIEQFRIYEAIESGSIPILAKEGGCPGGCPDYAVERLPPEYFSSPMVVIDDWDTVVETMLELESNQTALLERQIQLREWYYHYMHSKITEMEDALHGKE